MQGNMVELVLVQTQQGPQPAADCQLAGEEPEGLGECLHNDNDICSVTIYHLPYVKSDSYSELLLIVYDVVLLLFCLVVYYLW